LTIELLKCLPSELANLTTAKLQVTVQLTMDATVLDRNNRLTPTVLGHRPVDPLKVATAPAALAVIVMSFLIAIQVAEVVAAGAPRVGLAGEPVAEATAVAEATRTSTSPESHAEATMPAKKLKNYDARSPPRQATTTSSPPSLLSFATYFSWRNSNSLGITKYGVKQDPVQWLRCYALSNENAGGNNDRKCLCFPFCLDQAPLTWLESLKK
jgi:hypothetical protein